ncbi:proline-rich protein HaeIII subfamily 1-like [Penaeus monodon]|uniref:proline-rich protein HaeIII subfamily 1-like n=1 Tax=Penaeus monodon TaxID=6687 RepID=UPI0018A7E190|nr:proline-rich protein HaeIII subfamily 1-like [Penaeus monodon]
MPLHDTPVASNTLFGPLFWEDRGPDPGPTNLTVSPLQGPDHGSHPEPYCLGGQKKTPTQGDRQPAAQNGRRRINLYKMSVPNYLVWPPGHTQTEGFGPPQRPPTETGPQLNPQKVVPPRANPNRKGGPKRTGPGSDPMAIWTPKGVSPILSPP